MTDGNLRIGFIGVGKMGQCAHLRNYALIDGCEVVAIAELRQDTAHKVAARYGVPNVYEDYEAMLANEELDAVVAVQAFQRHGILIPELRKRKLPVFVEKPLANSEQVGEEICKVDEANNGFLMVGYHKLSDPATMYAKSQIAALKISGEIGALNYVRITMPPGDFIAGGFDCLIQGDDPTPTLEFDPLPPDMDEEARKKHMAFSNYYIHQVNLLRHFLGDDYSVKYVDSAEKLLVCESNEGITGIIEMAPYGTSVDWQEEALVCFEKGWMKLALPAPLAYNRPGNVTIYKDPGDGVTPTVTAPCLKSVHAMRQQAMNFLAAVRCERPPICDARTALKDLQTAREYIRFVTGK